MKKIFFIFILSIITALSACANTNYLHTITLEKGNTGYNIILDTDGITKVSRKVNSNNELVLELNGIKSADTVNALYKGTDSIENLVVENSGINKIKIYIQAPDIKSSSIIIKPSKGESLIVADSFPLSKTIWSIFVIGLFSIIFITSKKKAEQTNKLFIKRDIKDREIELYRRYKQSFNDNRNVENLRMKNMIKKIDRKIDERLASSIK